MAKLAGDYLAANLRIVTGAELLDVVWRANKGAAASQPEAAISKLRKGTAMTLRTTGWRMMPRP